MLRILRSLFPFILVCFGFTLIALAILMPLFEWQISEFVTDLPSEININSSWTTKFGDSLENGSYNAKDGAYIFDQVLDSKNGNRCSPVQLTSVVRRSKSDEMIERISLISYQRILLPLAGLTQAGQFKRGGLLFLCGVYVWWFTISHKRPIIEAVILTVIALGLLGFLIIIWRLLVPQIGVFVCLPELRGAVSFDASLSKVHYETLLVLFAGICAEVGALAMMLRQLIRIIFEGRKALN